MAPPPCADRQPCTIAPAMGCLGCLGCLVCRVPSGGVVGPVSGAGVGASGQRRFTVPGSSDLAACYARLKQAEEPHHASVTCAPSLSLSLSIYIYIHTLTHTYTNRYPGADELTLPETHTCTHELSPRMFKEAPRCEARGHYALGQPRRPVIGTRVVER